MHFRTPSFVEVDGRKLAYNEVIPAHPRGSILLLTGLGAKRYGWYYQLDEFGRFYRTIALDHRDISDNIRHVPIIENPDQFNSDVLAFLEK